MLRMKSFSVSYKYWLNFNRIYRFNYIKKHINPQQSPKHRDNSELIMTSSQPTQSEHQNAREKEVHELDYSIGEPQTQNRKRNTGTLPNRKAKTAIKNA